MNFVTFLDLDLVLRTFYCVPLKAMPSRSIIVTRNIARGIKFDLVRPSVGLRRELMLSFKEPRSCATVSTWEWTETIASAKRSNPT